MCKFKHSHGIVVIIVFIIIYTITFISYHDNYIVKDTSNIEYVKIDTIHDTIYQPVVHYDSIAIHSVDSLEKELFLAKYKLNRIAEYNRIAGQGNNIKFLRGWINRTLK